MSLKTISPAQAKDLMNQGAVLVDIPDADERTREIGAGSLVILGIALGYLASPWFFLLSGFVGAGLLQAGLTGWCGMANLPQFMPWARPGLAQS